MKNLGTNRLRILHPRAKFYRIILDEAHNIKNKDAVVSRAAAALDAQYRLCMTGTPFMNCATEIFPLIRFLKIAPYNDWTSFNEDIDRPIMNWDGDLEDKGMCRLRKLLRDIMLRRTKSSSLDGRPILRLPPRTDLLAYAEFDNEQRKYYHALERRQQLRFNKYLKAGTVMKNYVDILVLLLRLRQACDHPHLIKDHGLVEGINLGGDEMIDLALQLDDTAVATILSLEGSECPMCREKPENPIHIHPCGHHICDKCFAASIKNSQSERDTEDFDYVYCPHDRCGVQITPRNIFMHSSFVNAHTVTQFEADNKNLDFSENEGYEEDEPRGFPTYDGPADDRSFDYSDIDEEWEGNYEGLFMTQSPKPQAQSAPGGEQLSLSHNIANDHAGNASVDENEILRPPQGTSERPDIVGEENDINNLGGAVGENAAGGNVQHMEIECSREIVDLTLSETASDVDDEDASPIKRRRIDGGGSDRSLAYKHFRDMLSFNHEVQDTGDERQVGVDDVGNDIDADSDIVSIHSNRDQFVSFANLRSGARGVMAQQRYHQRLRTEWVSSAKIDKIMELLNGIRKHRPKEKTLVFSLWPSFLDLLEVAIEASGLVYNRYNGKLSPDARYAAVQNFQEDPALDVMLVSLTAGNAGLNLTAATQVIIVEPFWNPYVEEQAIDRAHRIGQRRAVTVHRVLIKGTVEDRILRLQEKKKNLVNAALGENGTSGAGRLTVGELEGLFGV